MAYAVDVAIFNLLRAPLSKVEYGLLVAKIIAGLVSSILAWAGNRNVTFRMRDKSRKAKDLVLYFLIVLIGLLIGSIPILITHYMLGLRSALMDNIAANVFGFILATAFRFTMFNIYLYPKQRRRSGTNVRGKSTNRGKD